MTYKNLARLAEIRKIVLGSSSPRRIRLLEETGIRFRQLIPDIDEKGGRNAEPCVYARRLAEAKSLATAREISPDEIAIGADTVVILENEMIGKPADEETARLILLALSGKRHTVCTALAFSSRDGLLVSGLEQTDVYFNKVSISNIDEYIKTGEPMDKAGAYGIQGKGAFLVDRFEGNLDNIIGLPRQLLDKLAGEVCSKMENIRNL